MTDYVYRAYDANGFLLYVGLTASIGSRMAQHRRQSRWLPEAKTISFTIYQTRPEAAAEEKRAIREEFPLYNLTQFEITGQKSRDEVVEKNRALLTEMMRRQIEARKCKSKQQDWY